MNRIPAWIAIVLCSPYLIWGTTLKVPEDYATIQEALDAAEQHDSVVVAPAPIVKP